MKNLKNLLPLFALMLGFGFVISTTSATNTDKMWGLDENGIWHDIATVPGECVAGEVCIGFFDPSVDPNQRDPITNEFPTPKSTLEGLFQPD